MGNNVDGQMYNGAPIDMGAVNDWSSNMQAGQESKMDAMRASQPQRGMAQYNYDRTGMTPGMMNLPPESLANQQQQVQDRNQEMFRTQSGQGQNLQAERMPQSERYTDPATGGRSAYDPAMRPPVQQRAAPRQQWGGRQQALSQMLRRGGRGRRGRD